MTAARERVEVRSASGLKLAVHFGAEGRRLFGFYHPPGAGAWRGVGVVLCNPIGTDQTRSERTYRHLAERLAAAGFPCLRFDLFATGDSGGAELSAGMVRGWVGDVDAAIAELRARSGVSAVSLVGLRLGATLAFLRAAEGGDVDALVLWSPCVSGAGFVAEVTKLHKLYARIEAQMAGAPRPVADGEEALGCFLPRALVGELAGVDLLQTPRPAGRVLVLDGGNQPGLDALRGRLGELHAAVDLQKHPGHKFLFTVSHRAVVPNEPIDAIVAWLSAAHPAVAGQPRAASEGSACGPSGERPVVFGRGRPLFGILTPADAAARRRGGPSIVLSNAGCVNRAGPHGMYARMARRWAAQGFDVLRVDLSGIGDSPVAPGQAENLTYPESGLDDLSDAIRSLGDGRAIIAGLCSGGDYAFQLGAHDPRAAGAWLLNPRTFSVLDLVAVESGVPPAAPVVEVPRMLRAMAERGVDTLLVASRNDPGVAYVDAHAAAAMRALEGQEGFRRVDLDGADHSFTPVVIQARVSDLLSEHLGAFAAEGR